MKKIVLAAIGVASLAAIAPAAAQAPAPRVQDQLGEPGYNGLGRDNVVSRASLHREVQSLFARLDVNRDGFLTRAETRAARQGLGADRRANRRALNGGQRRGNPMAAFDRMDSDRNGVISRAEFAQRTAVREQRRAARALRAPRGGNVLGLGGRMFAAADVNRDTRLSIQEATAAAFQRFDQRDLNRDGLLTREERRQSRQLLRSQRQRG